MDEYKALKGETWVKLLLTAKRLQGNIKHVEEYALLLGALILTAIMLESISKNWLGFFSGILFTGIAVSFVYTRISLLRVISGILALISLAGAIAVMDGLQLLKLLFHTSLFVCIAYLYRRSERALAQAQLKIVEVEHLAYHDKLTGLPNRRLFDDRLSQALLHAKRSGQLAAVLFLDLDKFKDVNDLLGHAVGDVLIQITGERLLSCVREGDTVYRQGGDEFTVLLEYITKPEDVRVVAARIQAALEKPFLLGGQLRYITASIGIAVYPGDGESMEQIMKHADSAMYRAKDSGPNKYRFFAPEMDARIATKADLEDELRLALINEELELNYQPQFDLMTNALAGMELKIVWKRKGKGLVPEEAWRPIAEDTGLMVGIGEWAMHKACRQQKHWQNEGLPALKLSVYLSIGQFKKDNLVDRIALLLNETELNPGHLELDLADGISSLAVHEVTEKLQQLKELGVGIAMDDLCAGLFTLSNLKHLPMNTLKMDSALIRDLDKDRENQALAVAISSMADRLHVNLIAKGVETKEQLKRLQELKCKEAQGGLFSQALPANEFRLLLERRVH
jgi:diguanylate cyclase (GGDEF)-like protein